MVNNSKTRTDTVRIQLIEEFPNFFKEKKSSKPLESLTKSLKAFSSKRSKSPSISLKENLTTKQKALFIKTYHDLVIEKYQEIKSTKKEEPLDKEEPLEKAEKAEKEKNFLEELKKLDKEVKKLLDEESKKLDKEVKKILAEQSPESDEKVKKLLEQPKKLDEELYELSPVRYPQSPILGINALTSRKKSISIDDEPSLKAMSGEELFKFYLLSDLIEQQIKIDKLEKSKTIQEKQLGENATKIISLKKAEEDLNQAKEDLEKAREKLKQPKTDLEQAVEDLKKAKEDLEKAQKKVAEKYTSFKKLSALEEIKGNLEKEKITKANIISTINYLHEQKDFQFSAEDLKIFSDSYRRSKDPSKQNPLLLIKNIYDGAEAKTPQIESLNATIDSNANPKLNADFIDLIKQELLKEKLLKELLKNFMKFSKAKGHSKAKFEKSYRNDLVAFSEACPSEKERLDVITSFALKLGISEKNLEVKFYSICANDEYAELKDLQSSNIADDRHKKLQAKIVDYLFKIKEIDPNFKMGPEELSASIESPNLVIVKPEEQPLATTTSLFLGFIPAKNLMFIAKNISLLAENLETFNLNFRKELEDPNSNVFKAFCSALNPGKTPPTKQP
jgi:hypothetical protein